MTGGWISRACLLLAVLSGWMVNPLAAFELLRSSGQTCSADPNLRWSPAQVTVDTGDLGAADRALADSAVSAWRGVLGSRLTFVSGNGGVCDLDDGVTTLAFTDVDCQGAPYQRDTLAITVSSWRGNRITDADVSFNANVNFSDAQFRQVAMHEIGHVIGLDHSNACGESGRGTLMNSSLVEAFAVPQADDINGALFIYGGGATGTPTPPPEFGVPDGANGCAVVEPTTGGGWSIPLGGGLAIGLVWRAGARRRGRAEKLFR